MVDETTIKNYMEQFKWQKALLFGYCAESTLKS